MKRKDKIRNQKKRNLLKDFFKKNVKNLRRAPSQGPAAQKITA